MKWRFLVVVASLLLAPMGWAQGPLYVNVGQAKTLKVGKPVASFKASPSGNLKVRKKTAREIELVGLEKGRTNLVLKLQNGDVLELEVQVFSPGTIVY